MSADRRRHGIETLPDGRLIDRDTERWWLDGMLSDRPVVRRLSLSVPELQETGRPRRKRPADLDGRSPEMESTRSFVLNALAFVFVVALVIAWGSVS